MIEAKELRLGNKIQTALNHTWLTVRSIVSGQGVTILSFEEGTGNYTTSAEGSDIEAIPLTLEILEKCRFINGVLQIKDIGSITSANKGTDIAFTVNDIWTASRWFQSLHQLQNLYYFLTGKELDINL